MKGVTAQGPKKVYLTVKCTAARSM